MYLYGVPGVAHARPRDANIGVHIGVHIGSTMGPVGGKFSVKSRRAPFRVAPKGELV
jgi:hypothetical protein